MSAVDLHVSLIGRNDLTGEIYRQLRRAILDGRLPPGARLPASRELAAQLSVSRTTVVVVAYDEDVAGEPLGWALGRRRLGLDFQPAPPR